MKYDKIKSFAGLRFIMILIIVLSHFDFLLEIPSIKNFYFTYLLNPYMAVDFFFVVSGFGMMLSYLNRISFEQMKFPSPLENLIFGIRHVKKIYPLYIATILFGFLWNNAIFFYRHQINSSTLGNEILLLLINLPILQSLFGSTYFTHAFNGVTWFLSTLFCIYLISPMLLYAVRKSGKNIFIKIGLLALDFILFFIVHRLLVRLSVSLMKFEWMPELNLLCLQSPYIVVFKVIAGMILALIYAEIKEKFSSASKFIAEKHADLLEISISVVSTAWFFARTSLPIAYEAKYFLDMLIALLMVFIFAFDSGIVSKFLCSDKMQALGNLTMYIFLIHYPVRKFLNAVMTHFMPMSLSVGLTEIALIIPITFVLSWGFCFGFKKNEKIAS